MSPSLVLDFYLSSLQKSLPEAAQMESIVRALWKSCLINPTYPVFVPFMHLPKYLPNLYLDKINMILQVGFPQEFLQRLLSFSKDQTHNMNCYQHQISSHTSRIPRLRQEIGNTIDILHAGIKVTWVCLWQLQVQVQMYTWLVHLIFLQLFFLYWSSLLFSFHSAIKVESCQQCSVNRKMQRLRKNSIFPSLQEICFPSNPVISWSSSATQKF